MKTIFEKLANLTECSCYYIENYSVEKESSVDETWRIFPLGRYSAPVTASFLEKISFDHTEDFHKIPNVFTRDLKIFTALILIDNEDSMDAIVIGPVSIRALSESALKRYYSEYGLTPDIGRNPAVIPFRRFMDLLLAFQSTLGRGNIEDEILEKNHLPKTLLEDTTWKDHILFEMNLDREEMVHHTYQEERYLLSCVREGRTEAALQQNAAMDIRMGRMSGSEIIQWKKIVTVAITLCARAAIEGGLSPAKAYSISDFFLQKSDSCKTSQELIDCRNQAIKRLTDSVHERNEKIQRSSSYVERCKDYISKNFKSKIYLAEIADTLGISKNYLSRVFAAETGETLQDYMVRVRVDKAANLLIYSEESIADIAEYVGFPSSSYFGRAFKRYKNMTPAQYRNKYKPAEYSSS